MNDQPKKHGELDPMHEPRDHSNAWDCSTLGHPKSTIEAQDAQAGRLDPSHQKRDYANAWDTSAFS